MSNYLIDVDITQVQCRWSCAPVPTMAALPTIFFCYLEIDNFFFFFFSKRDFFLDDLKVVLPVFSPVLSGQLWREHQRIAPRRIWSSAGAVLDHVSEL